MTTVLDGQNTAKSIRENLKLEIDKISMSGQRVPSLTVVIVGEDPASQTYVASKAKQAKAIGMKSDVITLNEDISEKRLLETIIGLNNDDTVDGILVQLPLPKHLDENRIIDTIDPLKDVDGLHPYNVGLMELNRNGFIPCTPKGIIRLLDTYDISTDGKRALVIGRSRLVGKPVATLLTRRNATVTLAHSKTKDLQSLIQEHEIIVVALGRKEFIDASWINDKHVLIDVGIHRTESGLRGDVHHDAYTIAKYATPVPKGVGPMTIAMLLENTLQSYQRRCSNDN